MTAVDWSRPIEAVHDDGRVVAVDRLDTTKRTDMTWWAFFGGKNYIVDLDGFIQGSDWRIRNVAEPAAELPQNVRSLEPALVERMVALVRQLADCPLEGQLLHDVDEEARAIVADPGFPAEVDEDERFALDLVREAYPEVKASYRGRRYQIALAALRRGKQLAATQP